MARPPRENPSFSIAVNGQGPAMHDTRALRNCLFCSPVFSDREPRAAFHLPSGEQGGRFPHGTFPVLAMSKVRTAVPTVVVLVLRVAYRTRIFEMRVSLP